MPDAERDAPCTHPHVKTFRSHPPRSVCQDCGAVVRLSWCDPAATPRPIPPAEPNEPMGEQGWVTHRWTEGDAQRAARHTSNEECPGCVTSPAEGRA